MVENARNEIDRLLSPPISATSREAGFQATAFAAASRCCVRAPGYAWSAAHLHEPAPAPRSQSKRGLAFPLVVIGMNAIAAYLIAHLCEEFVESSLRIKLGTGFLNMPGNGLETIVPGTLTLAIYWLMLFWRYRKKLFIRIQVDVDTSKRAV